MLKLSSLPPMPKFVAKGADKSKEGKGEGVGGSKGKMNANWKTKM